MSETPEEDRPAAAPPPPENPPENPPAPPSVAHQSRPATSAPQQPVYQKRGFQLAAVGIVGLLLGGAIGLGIGLTAGFAFGHHDRPDVGHHQRWGPGDGYRQQPDRKRIPAQPYMPPRKPPTLVSPSPQAS